MLTPPQPERRRAIRFACHAPAACSPTAAPECAPWPATVRDLSVSGIGLTLERPCAPGDLIEVRLRSLSGETEQARLVLVVHATSQPGETWAVGGMFYRELSWQELKALRSGPPA